MKIYCADEIDLMIMQDFPYGFTPMGQQIDECMVWCAEKYGKDALSPPPRAVERCVRGGQMGAPRWRGRFRSYYCTFDPKANWLLWGGGIFFKNPDAAIHFKLRWDQK